MTDPAKRSTRRQLEAASEAYLQPSVDRQLDRRIIEMVSEYTIPRLSGSHVLELGVGDRVWTSRLLDRFEQVTTVDASSTLMEQLASELRGHAQHARWTSAITMFEDYLPDQRFDLVLAAYVLDHLEDPAELLNLARRRWLQPDGRLVVIVAHAQSIHRRLAVEMGLAEDVTSLGRTNLRMAQRWCFRHDQLDELVTNSGFRIVEKRGLLLKPLPNDLLAHCTEAQLRGLFQLGQTMPLEYSAILYYELET